MIAAFILFSIAATSFIWSIIITVVSHKVEWLFTLILSFTLCVFGIAQISLTPTISDVRKGKANYIEQNHIEILNGDTINTYKTYSLEWNKQLNEN